MNGGTSTTVANSLMLVDTQALVWSAIGDPRLSAAANAAITSGTERLFVSAVTAYEFADLNQRGRFGIDLPLRMVLEQLEARVLDYPGAVWTIAESLPPIHFDPVDRMLVAHAIHADLTIITADAKMREYPVRTLW